jgi:hypothetical protein
MQRRATELQVRRSRALRTGRRCGLEGCTAVVSANICPMGNEESSGQNGQQHVPPPRGAITSFFGVYRTASLAPRIDCALKEKGVSETG